MNASQIVAKNATLLLLSDLISKSLAFFYTIYTAHYLGADGYGIISFAIAFTAIFSVFPDMGLSTLLIREVAKERSLAAKYCGSVLALKLILGFVTFIIIAVIVNLLNYPEITIKVVYLVALSVVVGAFSATFGSIFQAFERMEYVSIGKILNNIFMMIGVIYGITHGFGVLWFAILYFICSVISLGYSLSVCAWKFVLPNMEVDWHLWKHSLKEAWPMGAMALCIMIYFRVDVVMLSVMKGNSAVGLYSAAYQLSEASTMIPAMVVSSLFPLMSRYYLSSRESFTDIFERSFKYLLYLALPISLLITLWAEPIIDLIYGDEFAGSAMALQVLIWAAAIMYVSMLVGTAMVTANRQMIEFKINVVAAILNIGLNFMIIPKYSYTGASAATVATEAFGLLASMYFLNRYGYKLEIKKICMPPFLGLLIAAAISIILIAMGINILIVSTIAAAAYLSIIFKMGLKEDDMRLIKTIIKFPSIESSQEKLA